MPVGSIRSRLELCTHNASIQLGNFMNEPVLTNISVWTFKPEVFVYYLDTSSNFIQTLEIKFIYLFLNFCEIYTYFVFLFCYLNIILPITVYLCKQSPSKPSLGRLWQPVQEL